MKIKIVELIGNPVLLSPDKAEVLFYTLMTYTFDKNKIVVDFDGYKFLSSTFLNNSFGKIILDLGLNKENYNKKITVKNIRKDDMVDYNLALDNAFTKSKWLSKGIDPQKFYTNTNFA